MRVRVCLHLIIPVQNGSELAVPYEYGCFLTPRGVILAPSPTRSRLSVGVAVEFPPACHGCLRTAKAAPLEEILIPTAWGWFVLPLPLLVETVPSLADGPQLRTISLSCNLQAHFEYSQSTVVFHQGVFCSIESIQGRGLAHGQDLPQCSGITSSIIQCVMGVGLRAHLLPASGR